MKIINLLQNYFKKRGFVIKKYPYGGLKRRVVIIKHLKVDHIIDVGANKGQYALKMRSLGYQGKISSFEPLKKAFQILQKNAVKDDEVV